MDKRSFLIHLSGCTVISKALFKAELPGLEGLLRQGATVRK